MTALNLLGVLCIILVCFGPAVGLIVNIYTKQQPTQIDKDGKRELKINRISFWDYLILIIPICLILTGLLANEQNERATSFMILGTGYMMLILSSYNRRIDIPKINWILFSICLTLVFISYLLGKSEINYSFSSGINSLTILYFPAAAYIFLHASRYIIKLTTNTYPITLDKYFGIGHFHTRYNRKTTYWDLAWTLISMFGFPLTINYFALIK